MIFFVLKKSGDPAKKREKEDLRWKRKRKDLEALGELKEKTFLPPISDGFKVEI